MNRYRAATLTAPALRVKQPFGPNSPPFLAKALRSSIAASIEARPKGCSYRRPLQPLNLPQPPVELVPTREIAAHQVNSSRSS
jgi:hypothetical protein